MFHCANQIKVRNENAVLKQGRSLNHLIHSQVEF